MFDRCNFNKNDTPIVSIPSWNMQLSFTIISAKKVVLLANWLYDLKNYGNEVVFIFFFTFHEDKLKF